MSGIKTNSVKLLMDFDVTPTSHTLADYKARGGYGALAKALKSMTPVEVTKEVSAAGLLGHGGAAFPAGRSGVSSSSTTDSRITCV